MIEVDLFLKLIDKLKELFMIRSQINRVVFESHVVPIFNDLRVIYDDYKSMFEVARDLVASEKSKEAIIFLEKQRTFNKRLRNELIVYLKACEKEQSQFLKDFSKQASNLIIFSSIQTEYSVHAEYGYTKTSGSTLLIEQLKDWRPGYPIGHVNRMIRALDQQWDLVSKTYYDLRVNCLK